MPLPSLSPPYCPNLSFINPGLETIPLEVDGNKAKVRFTGQSGLYQFTAVADAAEFDWESLYVDLHEHGNTGQRTGPWDFHPTEGARALVPSFWVELNGKQIGLWFFQRVSLADLAAKRFRGRMAFYLAANGEHELTFTSYHENPLPWALARLESDPEDFLLPELRHTFLSPPPAARWADDAFWEKKRALIKGAAHDVFAKYLEPAFKGALEKGTSLPLLLTMWRLNNDDATLHALQSAVEKMIALPHWGNPRADGYSHDGDMDAALNLRHLAWVWRATEKHGGFPQELRARLLQKVQLQGERFFDLALLNRDYWGGSVLQDHGWRSFFTFADAALHLLGKIPQADLWTRYTLPRIDRSLKAMPRDGVIPVSSYGYPHLYLDDLALYRDTRLAFDGVDIYQYSPVNSIPQYLHAVLRPADGFWMTSNPGIGGDVSPFFGGGHFLAQLAALGNPLAAQIGRLSLQQTPSEADHETWQKGRYPLNVLHTLLASESDNPVLQEQPSLAPPPHFSYFEDSGLVHYRDIENDVTFAVRCGPWNGYHAERHATGPCDQMMLTPDAGHFILARGKRPLLTTPDFGYCLRAAFRSCLLVDGQGQKADVGYPMSIPSQPHCGALIEAVQWSEKEQQLSVRLHLTAAYPDELNVAFYIREFTINPRGLRVCDEILLDNSRSLTWHFQGNRAHKIEIDEQSLSAVIGDDDGIRIEAHAPELGLQISQHETELVWSYTSSSGFQPFDHIRFITPNAVRHARAEFRVTWSEIE